MRLGYGAVRHHDFQNVKRHCAHEAFGVDRQPAVLIDPQSASYPWNDMHHSVAQLLKAGRAVFLVSLDRVVDASPRRQRSTRCLRKPHARQPLYLFFKKVLARRVTMAA